MGWVTLTLRKTELKRTHADYQMELLQISRTKRQMARQYHYQQLVARNDQQAELRAAKEAYDATKESIFAGNANATFSASGAAGTTGNSGGPLFNLSGGTTGTSGTPSQNGTATASFNVSGQNSSSGTSSSASASTIATMNVAQQNALDTAREDYSAAVNDIRTRWEDELAMIEEEANDTETDLDQQQVQIEAQLEAISAEIEAVGQAVSDQIKASTIKLA